MKKQLHLSEHETRSLGLISLFIAIILVYNWDMLREKEVIR